MEWFGKSSKVYGKNDIENLGITSQPIVFYPDRNEYELQIEVPGCAKDLIKLTYDKPSGKLKLQGQKHKTEFVQQFSIPADCLATGIYGRFRGDILHIIMPRCLSELPASEDASSKQGDDQKASSDRNATAEAGENRDNLPDTVPAPLPSDQKSTDVVREGGGKDRDELELTARVPSLPPSDQKSTDEVRERGGKDRDAWPARAPAPPPPPSNQESIDELKEIGGRDRAKLPARVPSIPPSDQKTTEKSKLRDDELFPEISAPPPSGRESSRSVKELREKFQKSLSKTSAPPSPRAAAPAPSNRKTTEIRASKKKEEDREPPSDQKEVEQGDVESENSVVNSPRKKRKSGQEVVETAKIVIESKAKEGSKEKKPSAGGNETSGMVAKVKETGKAAVAAAMKEENRLVVMIGAAVLAIVVIGASLRSSSRKTRN